MQVDVHLKKERKSAAEERFVKDSPKILVCEEKTLWMTRFRTTHLHDLFHRHLHCEEAALR